MDPSNLPELAAGSGLLALVVSAVLRIHIGDRDWRNLIDLERESRREADSITHEIIGAAIAVHESLGPCLLESTYEECLALEFGERGLAFERQLWLPVRYKSLILEKAYSVDLLVAGAVIVELKAVEKILAVHEAQVLTYMKLSGHHRGLLLNFNVKLLKHGIRRFNLTE